jgi:hypothetical protein
MWPLGGKSEEDARTANAEREHTGDYAAACRRIAQLEIALQDLEDQHADLKHAYDLAQGTAEVLASKIVDVKSKKAAGKKTKTDVEKTEHFLRMNQEFGADPATQAFLAGIDYEPSQRAWKKGQKNKAKVEAWLFAYGVRHRGIEAAALSASENLSISFRTAQSIVSKWVKKHGYSKPGKKI